MSEGSFGPDIRREVAELRRQAQLLEDAVRKGSPHRLTDHTDVDLQGAAEASALVRGTGAVWRPGTAGGGQPHGNAFASGSVATGTDVVLSLGTFQLINGGATYFSVAAGVLEVATTGTFRLAARCTFDINGTGSFRSLTIERRAGSTWSELGGNSCAPRGAGLVTFVAVSLDQANFVAGQAFRIVARQDSGSTISVNEAKLAITYLGLMP